METKDKIATCVLPIVWGGNVVAVLQLTAPDLDPLGVFYDANHALNEPNGGTSLEQQNKILKHMSVTLRDMMDFSDVNADQDFAASFSVDALFSPSGAAGQTQAAQPQTLLARARTLRGQMMYQLMQLCLELRLDEERSVALMSLISTLAETFGRHFPPNEPTTTTTTTQFPPEASFNETLTSLQRSPGKEDFTLPPPLPPMSAARAANGSFVGLVHHFSQTTTELHQVDHLQRTLTVETASLSHLVEKLKRSREKYLHKAEQLQMELASSQQSLEVERSVNKKLSHTVKKAESRLR